jgi:hypothetical protein
MEKMNTSQKRKKTTRSPFDGESEGQSPGGQQEKSETVIKSKQSENSNGQTTEKVKKCVSNENSAFGDHCCV